MAGIPGNYVLNISVAAWATAQVLKVIIVLITQKKIDFTRFIGAGGMPSSHSAFVTAMAVGIARVSGMDTPIFAIAVVFAAVVMYDASGVRRAAGEQAKVLNYMMDNWTNSTPEMFQKNLKELLGHTPLQVFAGALLGLLLGIIL